MDIIAIDDDNLMRHTISMVLEDSFGDILTAEHPQAALPFFELYDIRLVLLDLNFAIGDSDGAEGLAWIKKMKEQYPDVSIIVLTAHGFVDIAVRALKQGASDFLEKPFSNEKLIATVRAGINLAKSQKALNEMSVRSDVLIHQANQFDQMIIGESTGMQQVMATVNKVADTDASLLITGEHGTGKEMLARYIHQKSQRATEPIIHADLGSISASLFESTLFGHIKGAFTDASEHRAGLIEAANLGTLMLDELGDLPLAQQSKLLAVLQNREVMRIGEHRPRAVDIRLISVTHHSLKDLSEQTHFRQDLLFRINTVHIHLPPLRDRKVDIEPLANYFISYFNRKYGHDLTLSKADMKLLLSHPWPGNIRELKNSLERMVIMNQPDLITDQGNEKRADNLYEVEKSKIAEVMNRHSGNITHAASELGIGRNTLYRKLKKYDL